MKRPTMLIPFALVLLLAASACSSESQYRDAPDRIPYADTVPPGETAAPPADSGEEYDDSAESAFQSARANPLSTFSSDVDTASYSNMRRFINAGQAPVGVRIEELVNYFQYDYPLPHADDEHPFSITTEVGTCPWNQDHLLAMIGIQGARLENTDGIANNIVFLLDVSGSMADENKLPLLQQSLKLLVEELGEDDIISIVTYAGRDRIVADSIPASQRRTLNEKIDSLMAGGSTAGADGIRSAYALAAKNFIEGGNNRVILATDGDFNVGESSVKALTALIERERDKDIFISVLGFGMGNLKDNMMESIADHGNGNYAYIDTLREARKVLVQEFDATMYTIAKDMKIQVEFNPDTVAEYRLIGYNNRRLDNADFNDDTKDAGDVGAGHSVTAFYELVPAGIQGDSSVDSLRYQLQETVGSDDFMTVKVRYKQPDSDESRLVEKTVTPLDYYDSASEDFIFASAIAEFGLILTDSEHKGSSSLAHVSESAQAGLGRDDYGFRSEFVELVRRYEGIAPRLNAE